MSGPFVFNPITTEPPASPYFQSPYDPYAALPQNSPFIPNPSLFPGTPSPYSHNIPLPGSPHLGAPNTPVLFPTQYGADIPWSPRSRTTSFNGHLGDGALGGIGGVPEAAPSYYPGSLYNLYQQPQQQRHVQLHPWLDGNNARSDLWFDLSMGMFTPMRVIDMMGTRIPLTMAQLQAPASHPHVNGMRIVSDILPREWALDVDSRRPLSVGDVLVWIYKSMQLRIAHSDWYRLGETEQRHVARAYTRRCRALGPEFVNSERNQGVKRVDYLLGKVLFRGLVVDYQSGYLKMVFQ